MSTEKVLQLYFKGCGRQHGHLKLSYDQMEELRDKLAEQMRKGDTADSAFEDVLQDIMQYAPQAQDWLMDELLDSLPKDLKEDLKNLLKSAQEQRDAKKTKLANKRKKAFEDLLNKLATQPDPLKNLKQEPLSLSPMDGKSPPPQEKSMPLNHDQLEKFLNQLENTIKQGKGQGKKLSDIFSDLKQIQNPKGSPTSMQDLTPTKPSQTKAKRVFDPKTLKEMQKRFREELLKALKESGSLKLTQGQLTFGEDLIEIMADKILMEVLRQIKDNEEGAPADQMGEQSSEVLQIGLLQSQNEIDRMLPVETLLAAIQRHPREVTIDPWADPIHVWKYRHETTFDAVIAVDLSGSMNRSFKHQSAKETALALELAIRKINPRNRTQLIVFQTNAFPASPNQVWDTRPTGYTNTPEALRLAVDAIRHWSSKSAYILFVTDGFPELPGKSHQRVLREAIEEAEKLKGTPTVLFRMVLIENKPRFIDAGKQLVQAANGKLIITDPDRLRENVLNDFIQGFREIITS